MRGRRRGSATGRTSSLEQTSKGKGQSRAAHLLTSKLTDSMTSRKTSFLRYRIPSDRHETALVTAMGGRAWASSLCDSWVMYLENAHYFS